MFRKQGLEEYPALGLAFAKDAPLHPDGLLQLCFALPQVMGQFLSRESTSTRISIPQAENDGRHHLPRMRQIRSPAVLAD